MSCEFGKNHPEVINVHSMNGLTWGLKRLCIQNCWQRGFTGVNVRVGHLDTGVDGTHPALRDQIAKYIEFDPNGFPVSQSQPRDTGIHGTHIAGVICGKPSDNTAIGVAPDAELCSGVVIEGGKCLVRLLAGLDWILDCNIKVLCLSLGVPLYNPLFEIVLDRMKKAGILVVAPVGNRGPGHTCSPASYAGVLAVGAIHPKDKVVRFSGSQLFKRASDYVKPNLVAPGVDILSAKAGGGFHTLSGTSMAAAHVAGVATLLFQARPKATAKEAEEALLSSCEPLSEVSVRRCGRGLVNPLKAIEVILSTRRSYAGWRTSSIDD